MRARAEGGGRTVDALLLSSRHAAPSRISDKRVPDVHDPKDLEGVDDVLQLGLGGRGGGEPEHRVVVEVLVHRQIGVHDVILRHEADERWQCRESAGRVVDEDVARDVAIVGAAQERVHERGCEAEHEATELSTQRTAFASRALVATHTRLCICHMRALVATHSCLRRMAP